MIWYLWVSTVRGDSPSVAAICLGVEADPGGGIRAEARSQLAVGDDVGRQEHRVCVEQEDILPGWLLGDCRCGQQHGEREQGAGEAAASTGGEPSGPTRRPMDVELALNWRRHGFASSCGVIEA